MPAPIDSVALAAIEQWPVAHAAGAVVGPDGVLATIGDVERPFELASVTKPLSALAVLVACEEGVIGLDTVVDRHHGAAMTVRHLLAHAGGMPFEGSRPIAAPGVRRIYSNAGFDRLGEVVEAAAAMPFAEYLDEAVLQPLGMSTTALTGRPSAGAVSTVADLCRAAGELFEPRLVSPGMARAMRTVQYPGLAGIVPGIGRFDPCDWGLGVELKGTKRPHWMGAGNGPATFGHFGGAGTFLWVDEGARTALIVLTDRRFDQWSAEALRRWPALSDAVLDEFAGRAGS